MQNKYLYPVTVTHRCGHQIIRQMGGTRRDRESLAYDLRLKECEACRNVRGGREVIQIDGEDYVLPAIIVGSDAQIKWSVAIRRKLLDNLLGNRQPGENPVLWMESQITAKWWIDNRNKPATDLFMDYRKAA